MEQKRNENGTTKTTKHGSNKKRTKKTGQNEAKRVSKARPVRKETNDLIPKT